MIIINFYFLFVIEYVAIYRDVSRCPQKYVCFQHWSKMIPEQQISILELSLKTGVMMLKIQLCITGINDIFKYLKMEKLFKMLLFYLIK